MAGSSLLLAPVVTSQTLLTCCCSLLLCALLVLGVQAAALLGRPARSSSRPLPRPLRPRRPPPRSSSWWCALLLVAAAPRRSSSVVVRSISCLWLISHRSTTLHTESTPLRIYWFSHHTFFARTAARHPPTTMKRLKA